MRIILKVSFLLFLIICACAHVWVRHLCGILMETTDIGFPGAGVVGGFESPHCCIQFHMGAGTQT